MYLRKAAGARTFHYTAVYEVETRSIDEAEQLTACLAAYEPLRGSVPRPAPVPWFTDKVARRKLHGWEQFMDRQGAGAMMTLAARGSHIFIQDYPALGCSRKQLRTVALMLKRRQMTLHVAAHPDMTVDSLISLTEPITHEVYRYCWRWRRAQKKEPLAHPVLKLCVKYWEAGCSAAGLERRLKAAGAYNIDGVSMPGSLSDWLRHNGNREPLMPPWREFEDELKATIGDTTSWAKAEERARIERLREALDGAKGAGTMETGAGVATTSQPPASDSPPS